MKKVLAAALLCAVSSFATWDYFPVKPAGKGEVKAGVSYLINDDGVLSIPFGARFSVIEGLELQAQSGYGITAEALSQPEVGVRYWLPMGLGVFVDVGIPTDDPEFLYFHFGPQYSTKINEALAIGSEVGLKLALENEVAGVKTSPAMELNVGVEADYTIGNITPFLGVDMGMGLGKTKTTIDVPFLGKTETEVDGADPDIDVSLGAIFEITEMFSADASVTLGGLLSDGDIGITINAHVSVNF